MKEDGLRLSLSAVKGKSFTFVDNLSNETVTFDKGSLITRDIDLNALIDHIKNWLSLLSIPEETTKIAHVVKGKAKPNAINIIETAHYQLEVICDKKTAKYRETYAVKQLGFDSIKVRQTLSWILSILVNARPARRNVSILYTFLNINTAVWYDGKNTVQHMITSMYNDNTISSVMVNGTFYPMLKLEFDLEKDLVHFMDGDDVVVTFPIDSYISTFYL